MLPTLKARVRGGNDLLAFTDTDALRALEVITSRRPAMVLLEQRFAATPRGGALINRIKADPSLAETQVRIAPADPTAPVIEAEAVPPPKPRATKAHAAPPPAPQEPPPPQFVRAAPLDNGTRRIPRILVADAQEHRGRWQPGHARRHLQAWRAGSHVGGPEAQSARAHHDDRRPAGRFAAGLWSCGRHSRSREVPLRATAPGSSSSTPTR